MAGVSIRPVRSKRDLKRFVRVPFQLHRDHPQWVPPLILDRMQFLNRGKNPYFEHAEAEYFLAERDGEPVGRITAQLDRRWDEYQGGEDGMFGFFETVDDPEVAGGLLGAAEEWLRERGRKRLLGPMDFTTNDEVGLLIEGFEIRPMILQNWHPRFYRDLVEGAGYDKEMDLLMWHLALGELKEGDQFDASIHAAAENALREEGVTIRNIVKRNLPEEMRRFTEVYNEAWADNWGFVPPTEAEIEFHAKLLKQVIDERWAFVAEREGETVGVALTLPDINQVLAKMGGRLLPLGWLTFLREKPKVDRVRVFALGVKKAYRHTGVAAGLYLKHLEAASPDGVPAGETGWILETNEPMNRAMEGMGGKIVKRYRIYEKALAEPRVLRKFATCGFPGGGSRTWPPVSLRSDPMSAERASVEIQGEVLAEEDVETGPEQPVRAVESYQAAASPVLRTEVRTAALAAAGGVLAGAATVAAVRAVGAATSRGSGQRRLRRRKEQRAMNVVASRSFLVDVHVLGR